MSQLLPHMRFPIGLASNGDDNAPGGELCCLADTGAGLNVGRLGYHLDIYKKHPHLVRQFAYLKDCEGIEPFSLGGVVKDGESTGNDIEAIITYRTPFVVNGREVVV